jgi:hypothetical protein
MFAKLGVPGMGHIGSGWCNFDANGVLVLMSHQSYYRKREGKWFYDAPGDSVVSTSASAIRSIQMIADYFQLGRKIILPIGVFDLDGGVNSDGKKEAS